VAMTALASACAVIGWGMRVAWLTARPQVPLRRRLLEAGQWLAAAMWGHSVGVCAMLAGCSL
jgi:hypothetical protein